MKFETSADAEALSARGAELLFDQIRENPRAVLGLPTGRTPIGMYARVVSECSRDYRCFSDVTTFNLDEYVGIPREHPSSYWSFMRQHLFAHVDLDPARTHLPNGNAADLAKECERYDRNIRNAGGMNLTFLGLGRNGHIGFNEPGTAFDSHTRVVELTESTRQANAPLFTGPGEQVPTRAITMGIATILSSERIVLLVAGEGKQEAMERLRSREQSEEFPASALWLHDDVTVLSAV